MPNFAFYWKDGGREVAFGTNAADALKREGYTQDDLHDLQAYDRDYRHSYVWRRDLNSWTQSTFKDYPRPVIDQHNIVLDAVAPPPRKSMRPWV